MKSTYSQIKIFWISSIIFDLTLSKVGILELLRKLNKTKYKIILFGRRSKKLFVSNNNINFIIFPLRYIPIIHSFVYMILIFLLLPIYVIIYRPNIIIMGNGPWVICCLWQPIFKLLNCKFILDIRSTPVEIINVRNKLYRLWFKISILLSKKFFNGITTLTYLMKNEICKNYIINNNFIKVWSTGVDINLFDPDKYNYNKIRSKFNLSKNFIIFYHGIFQLTRGLIETIKAVEFLKKIYPDLVFFLLGNGPGLNIIKKLAEKNPINIIIHKSVDYNLVPYYIAMCDVGIIPLPDIPDWKYQAPLKLLEYLSMEKPVILTDLSGHREIVGNNKCGIYVSSTDPNKIAKAIKYAYDNKNKLKIWGKSGRKIMIENYTWEKVANDFEKIVESI